MVCKKCYYNNDENATFCAECGEKLETEVIVQNTSENINTQDTKQSDNSGSQYKELNNYSPASAIAALIVSISCCSNIPGVVFAILALIEGDKVKPAINKGDLKTAKLNYEQYKKWTKFSWISLIIWDVLIAIIYIIRWLFVVFYLTMELV